MNAAAKRQQKQQSKIYSQEMWLLQVYYVVEHISLPHQKRVQIFTLMLNRSIWNFAKHMNIFLLFCYVRVFIFSLPAQFQWKVLATK